MLLLEQSRYIGAAPVPFAAVRSATCAAFDEQVGAPR